MNRRGTTRMTNRMGLGQEEEQGGQNSPPERRDATVVLKSLCDGSCAFLANIVAAEAVSGVRAKGLSAGNRVVDSVAKDTQEKRRKVAPAGSARGNGSRERQRRDKVPSQSC